MISKLRGLWPVRRAVALAVGIWDTFLRDNKVIPPVLAVAALFVFAWIVVGSFVGTPDDEPVSRQGNQNEIAQSGGGDGGGQPPVPEIENPNNDSYAAYQSKDPFRQLFETAESTSQQEDTGGGTGEDAGEGTNLDDPTSDDFSDDSTPDDSSSDDGFEDDSTSDGNPGAADDQYGNGEQPREDPTDTTGTGETDDAGTPAPQAPAPQAPAPQTPPAADPGDSLFDSGGDLEDPYGR